MMPVELQVEIIAKQKGFVSKFGDKIVFVLQAEIQQWLREEKQIDIEIPLHKKPSKYLATVIDKDNTTHTIEQIFQSYEDALDAAISKGLSLI